MEMYSSVTVFVSLKVLAVEASSLLEGFKGLSMSEES
jgi:hypothetical protein